jgi:hypothetical protein
MPATPRRPWQFGIGTMLLLVTVFGVWLGWELNFIRERQAWIRDNEQALMPKPGSTREASIPWWRNSLGDRAIPSILVAMDASAQEREQLQSLFPEAEVWNFVSPFVPVGDGPNGLKATIRRRMEEAKSDK